MNKLIQYVLTLMIISFIHCGDAEDLTTSNKILDPKNPDINVICTNEAKICPDGSSVGRVGPNCEFAPCPEPASCKQDGDCSSYFDCDGKEVPGECLENGECAPVLLIYDCPVPECKLDNECGKGCACSDGSCHCTGLAECKTDADCEGKEGWMCIEGQCLREDPENCTSDDQCLDGQICADSFCQENIRYDDFCQSDLECGEGFYCAIAVIDCISPDGQSFVACVDEKGNLLPNIGICTEKKWQ